MAAQEHRFAAFAAGGGGVGREAEGQGNELRLLRHCEWNFGRPSEPLAGSGSAIIGTAIGLRRGWSLTMVLEESSTFVSGLHKQIPFVSILVEVRKQSLLTP